MTYPLFQHFRTTIDALTPRSDTQSPEQDLLLWRHEERDMSCYYAPFDHVNHDAKIIIVGITPGRTQMNRALMAAQQALQHNQSDTLTLQQVKQYASLSGSMRSRIVAMLNRLGYADKLGLHCCSQLWAEHHSLVHFCSILKYPIFIKGKDYNGQVNLHSIPALQHLLMNQFVQDISTISPDALIVPLGEMVANILTELSDTNQIKQPLPLFEKSVIAPPHPSGANAESIALLLMTDYPSLEAYQHTMFQRYMSKQSWLKKAGGKPQNEQKYKNARAARWHAIARVRAAYHL